MKQLFYILAIGLTLASCKKEKLEGNSRILEGKWKWSYSLHRHWNFATDHFDVTDIPSSNYPDEYFLEFDRKGKVKYIKNNNEENEYRIVFKEFVNECNDLSGPNCYRFAILLNNVKDHGLGGNVNQDTINCNDTNLPLERLSEINYYSHFYVRAN
ncbi:MAG: hypothetical protein JKY09_00525 [Crocinitomicaceae bacterium]|nr:hypothetical protein [Crocinitomicaceae bacterium]